MECSNTTFPPTCYKLVCSQVKALLLWVPKGGECKTDPLLIQIDMKYEPEIQLCSAQPLRFWCVLVTATLHRLQYPDMNSSSIIMMIKTDSD